MAAEEEVQKIKTGADLLDWGVELLKTPVLGKYKEEGVGDRESSRDAGGGVLRGWVFKDNGSGGGGGSNIYSLEKFGKLKVFWSEDDQQAH